MNQKFTSLFGAMILALSPPALANLDWPGLYNTATVLQLNVKLGESDWAQILADETFDIEVPALFWAAEDGENSAAKARRRSTERSASRSTSMNTRVMIPGPWINGTVLRN